MKWESITSQESYPSKFTFDGEVYTLILDTLFYRVFKSDGGKFAAAATVQDKSLVINENWIRQHWRTLSEKKKVQFNTIVSSYLEDDAKWIHELISLLDSQEDQI